MPEENDPTGLHDEVVTIVDPYGGGLTPDPDFALSTCAEIGRFARKHREGSPKERRAARAYKREYRKLRRERVAELRQELRERCRKASERMSNVNRLAEYRVQHPKASTDEALRQLGLEQVPFLDVQDEYYAELDPETAPIWERR